MIPLTSPAGKELFKRALLAGTASHFLSLSSVFTPQSEPPFCGLSSLSIVLNSLNIDPGRSVKIMGVWRWYSEVLLDCCVDLERVREAGITLAQLRCLGLCNGLTVSRIPGISSRFPLEKQVKTLEKLMKNEEIRVIVNYDRASLGQTGGGHFSPLAALDATSSKVLLLDVARFKYPPHWVSLEDLVFAGETKDGEVMRGFVSLRVARGVGGRSRQC